MLLAWSSIVGRRFATSVSASPRLFSVDGSDDVVPRGGERQLGQRRAAGVEDVDVEVLDTGDSGGGELHAQVRSDEGSARMRGGLLGQDAEPAQHVPVDVGSDLDVAAVGGDRDVRHDARRHAAEFHRGAHVEPLDRLV